MTDIEIKNYLNKNNWSISAQEVISKILNTSRQIINMYYDFDNNIMTIITPKNTFTFKIILKQI